MKLCSFQMTNLCTYILLKLIQRLRCMKVCNKSTYIRFIMLVWILNWIRYWTLTLENYCRMSSNSILSAIYIFLLFSPFLKKFLWIFYNSFQCNPSSSLWIISGVDGQEFLNIIIVFTPRYFMTEMYYKRMIV